MHFLLAVYIISFLPFLPPIFLQSFLVGLLSERTNFAWVRSFGVRVFGVRLSIREDSVGEWPRE